MTRVILVVGPSGAGKDTLIRHAKHHFAQVGRIDFARRYITRPPDQNEDNYFVDESAFRLLESARFFISTWNAHSYRYGIPGNIITDENNGAVLCSVSRSSIIDFESKCNSVTTIHVTVKKDVLFERLLKRGRETEEEIEKRLLQADKPFLSNNLITFDNSMSLYSCTHSFIDLLNKLIVY